MRKVSLLVIIIAAYVQCSAQSQEWSVEEIAKMESRRFGQSEAKGATSDIGQSYDWKYAVCKWEIDPWQRRIDGDVLHKIELLYNTDSIDFDFSVELDVIEVWVDGSEVFEYGISQNNSLFVKSSLFENGVEHDIRILYGGEPRRNNYLSFNQGFHGNSVPEIWTLSEPFGAADWWPCKMSLSDKLDSIRVEITVPDGNKAASQGILEEVNLNPDMSSTYVWVHRYPIPTYLVSIAVTNYEEFSYFAELENRTVEILNYVYPELSENEKERGADIIPMMQLFSQLFGEYPYAQEKYGHAQASIPGGMEHSTMSTMSGLSYNLSAHELAHQWFGNKVTCGSWSDIWLNEGFATYLTGLVIENLKPGEFDEWKAARISSITRQLGGSVHVNDTLDRDKIFNGRLTYNKGAYVLHMLRWVIGDEFFFEGCRNYLNDPDHSFSYAHTDDFIQTMEDVSGRDLTEFFKDWYYGEGFPSYRIEYSYSSEVVTIKVHQDQSHSSVQFFEMPIPIKIQGQNGDTTVVLENITQDQVYFIETDIAVESIDFDPDLAILSTGNSIVFDPSLNDNLGSMLLASPNPCATELRVFSRVPLFYNEYIEIYDNSGALVDQIQPAGGISNGHVVNTTYLAPGSYVIRFSNYENYTLRFVKL